MYIWIIKILSNLIITTLCIYLVINKINSFSFSINYLLWGLPILIINVLDGFFLIKSAFKKPTTIDIRFSTILISLGGASIMALTSFFLKYPPLPIYGAIYFKMLASLLNVLTYPFVIWALLCLKSCLTIVPEAHKVVASGIYKYSRHPLYMCYILWAITYILIFQSIPIIILSTVFIALTVLRMKREEDLLLETFPEYEDYYNNTGLLGIK